MIPSTILGGIIFFIAITLFFFWYRMNELEKAIEKIDRRI